MARAYAPVDGAKLCPILAGLPDLRARLGGKPAEWRVREVGDGNLNLVFIVEGPAGGRRRQAGAALCAPRRRILAAAARAVVVRI